jgi:TPR repeat protein
MSSWLWGGFNQIRPDQCLVRPSSPAVKSTSPSFAPLAWARRWTLARYRKAADHGHADAQHNLGNIPLHGPGVLQDYVLAHMWFNLAASRATRKLSEAALPSRLA